MTAVKLGEVHIKDRILILLHWNLILWFKIFYFKGKTKIFNILEIHIHNTTDLLFHYFLSEASLDNGPLNPLRQHPSIT